MKNKWNMTIEQNIAFAKRSLVDAIWKSARLEGLSVTFPQTDDIYNGYVGSGVSVDAVVTINNLKHAWQFLLANLDYPLDYPYVCKLNSLVGADNLIYRAGRIREEGQEVGIGGTSWKPNIPSETKTKRILAELMEIQGYSATDRALQVLCFLMRNQTFLDGNKRTAMLAANHILIGCGCGILSIPIEFQEEFKIKLIAFYETGNAEDLKEFLYQNCIFGQARSEEAKTDYPFAGIKWNEPDGE
ncbi:Fic family protein [Peptococcus simiae]|uniref:Fic family protein n=1 Tax=Peptococcus simiae TaxID=1643805 RepID=A0ABW9H1S0_9FIRM